MPPATASTCERTCVHNCRIARAHFVQMEKFCSTTLPRAWLNSWLRRSINGCVRIVVAKVLKLKYRHSLSTQSFQTLNHKNVCIVIHLTAWSDCEQFNDSQHFSEICSSHEREGLMSPLLPLLCVFFWALPLKPFGRDSGSNLLPQATAYQIQIVSIYGKLFNFSETDSRQPTTYTLNGAIDSNRIPQSAPTHYICQ